MKKFLFFDTETTGLPPSPYPPPAQVELWPRLVQLAFIVCDEQGRRQREFCEVIRPMGYEIPDDMIHGISHYEALRVGVPVAQALAAFQTEVIGCSGIVAHNFDFDFGVIAAEIIRTGGGVFFDSWDFFCTQKQTAHICKIPKRKGERGTATYKHPSLAQLHDFCGFGEIQDAHDAMADTIACARCFFYLREKHPSAFITPYLPSYA